jgi:hypothetical protein
MMIMLVVMPGIMVMMGMFTVMMMVVVLMGIIMLVRMRMGMIVPNPVMFVFMIMFMDMFFARFSIFYGVSRLATAACVTHFFYFNFLQK